MASRDTRVGDLPRAVLVLRAGVLAQLGRVHGRDTARRDSGVPAGQIEAARSLSLRPVTTFLKVVWPQALRLALPPYGNEVIGMLKTTALASTVTMAEITGVAETIVAETFAPYEVFLSAAVIYLILVWIFERFLAAVERSLRTP